MAAFIKEIMTNSSAYNFFISLDSLIKFAANFLTDIFCLFTFIRYLVSVSKTENVQPLI